MRVSQILVVFDTSFKFKKGGQPHLDLLLLLELRLGRWIGRQTDTSKGELGLWLPTLLEGELNLILKDVGDKGLVVGPVLTLNLDKNPIRHG